MTYINDVRSPVIVDIQTYQEAKQLVLLVGLEPAIKLIQHLMPESDPFKVQVLGYLEAAKLSISEGKRLGVFKFQLTNRMASNNIYLSICWNSPKSIIIQHDADVLTHTIWELNSERGKMLVKSAGGMAVVQQAIAQYADLQEFSKIGN